MNRLIMIVRALPPGVAWFLAAAVLALLGAANASLHGLQQLAQVGVGGAVVSLLVVWGACDWRRPPGLGRS